MKALLIALLTVNFTAGLLKNSNDDVLDLISEAGYAGEAHKVETEDGYLLIVHRVISPYIRPRSDKPPVFLMHGIFATSADYVITGPEKALAYLLVDHGYDVWMGNARGNKHSTKHKSFAPRSNKFWTFSWNEMGLYDLPAMIDYVLAVTRSRQVFYVGHSQGTTAPLVMLSSRPEYNQKILQLHLLAPVIFLFNRRHPFYVGLGVEVRRGLLRDATFLDLESFYALSMKLSKLFCSKNQAPCRNLFSILSGANKNEVEIDERVEMILLQHISPRISVMQLKHFMQMLFSGKFQTYDETWGKSIRYNSTGPSEYKLQNVIVPTYLYHAAEDAIISYQDVKYLQSRLPNVREFRIIDNWNHVDFNYGRNSRNVLYKDILRSFESAS